MRSAPPAPKPADGAAAEHMQASCPRSDVREKGADQLHIAGLLLQQWQRDSGTFAKQSQPRMRGKVGHSPEGGPAALAGVVSRSKALQEQAGCACSGKGTVEHLAGHTPGHALWWSTRGRDSDA